EPPKRWAAYYTNALPARSLSGYDLLVLDSHAHPDLQSLKERGKILLGYLSLAEIGDYRPAFTEIKRRGVLTAPIPSRRGYYYVDVRKPQWAAYVLETLIPDLLRKGFDGVMLDTADTALAEESAEPRVYGGMRMALVRLVRAIRLHYPHMKIMLNRGFPLLPEVAGEVDMVLAESIYSYHDAEGFRLQPAAHYRSVADMLKTVQAKHGTLIYTLDYWPENDKDGIRAIYAAQRAEGFIPYVSGIDLQSAAEEPK
ncbi:MAG: endo alpha-1,4 polygalactosaminidase, partial [Alphaproteobacteria bacterium]|nr:endo alpha-1,4 polygalactosaminidase [Alphaproteobacteria bacterium]